MQAQKSPDALATIEQAMQIAIASHRAGRYGEAEKMYTAILDAEPGLPDANHNLGVLYAAAKRANDSLPYLLKAIEGEPTVAQYWLSYIAALIGAGRNSEAVDVIALARSHGLDSAQVNELHATALAAAGTNAA